MPRMHPALIRIAMRAAERELRRKARERHNAPVEPEGDYDAERRKVDEAIQAALARLNTTDNDSGES